MVFPEYHCSKKAWRLAAASTRVHSQGTKRHLIYMSTNEYRMLPFQSKRGPYMRYQGAHSDVLGKQDESKRPSYLVQQPILDTWRVDRQRWKEINNKPRLTDPRIMTLRERKTEGCQRNRLLLVGWGGIDPGLDLDNYHRSLGGSRGSYLSAKERTAHDLHILCSI